MKIRSPCRRAHPAPTMRDQRSGAIAPSNGLVFRLEVPNGPDNHSRRTQFVHRMVEFVDAHDIQVQLAYYPPYHSKYNPVERVWGALENAWNGDLLDTIAAALRHAQSMKWNGNHPVVRFIDRIYEKGIRLDTAAMQALEERLDRLPGLEKWFVDIVPVPA